MLTIGRWRHWLGPPHRVCPQPFRRARGRRSRVERPPSPPEPKTFVERIMTDRQGHTGRSDQQGASPHCRTADRAGGKDRGRRRGGRLPRRGDAD